MMQWSKLKKRVEGYFASSVADRVSLHSTRYRGAHDQEGRGWISIDNEEVYNFCTLRKMSAENRLAAGIRRANKAEDYRDPQQREGYYEAGEQAAEIIAAQGLHSQYEFYDALTEYLSMSIDEAVSSEHLLHRAIAVLDRRFGKRRLVAFRLAPTEHALVRRLYRFRCEAEGIRPSPSPAGISAT
jgi:hypothetical protein